MKLDIKCEIDIARVYALVGNGKGGVGKGDIHYFRPHDSRPGTCLLSDRNILWPNDGLGVRHRFRNRGLCFANKFSSSDRGKCAA